MSDLRQAAQQALDEMLRVNLAGIFKGELNEAITALRAALAEPEPEPEQGPVAWFEHNPDLDAWFLAYSKNQNPSIKSRPLVFGDTAPPQRKPLTEEEIERACVPLGAAMLSFTEVARAIEAAHGIGEQHE